MVAPNALIGDGDVASGGRSLQAGSEDVGPAVVAISGCAVAVSDGVTKDNDGRRSGWGLNVDFTDLVPVVNVFWVAERRSADLISVHEPGCGAGAGVTGFAGGRRLEVEGDGEIRERRDRVVDGIRDKLCSRRNVGVRFACKGQRAIAGGINRWRRCGQRTRDVDRGDVESFSAEGIGEMQADGRSADGEVHNLAQSCVREIFRRQSVVGFGDLL